MCRFYFDFQEMTVFKTSKQHKKSAAEGGRLLRLFFRLLYSHFLEVQNKIYTYWVYLMEHIFFEVQLCIKISIFSEFCEFSIFCQIAIRRPVWVLGYTLRLRLRLSRKMAPRARSTRQLTLAGSVIETIAISAQTWDPRKCILLVRKRLP